MYCFSRFCRLCFRESPGLISFDTRDEYGVMLGSKMDTVFPSLIGDEFPPWLCVNCYGHLDQAFNFNTFCSTSYRKLERQHRMLKPVNGVINYSPVNNLNMNLNDDIRELRVKVGPDCTSKGPIHENWRYFYNLKFKSSIVIEREFSSPTLENSDCDTPKVVSLKRQRPRSDPTDNIQNKRRKIRFSDPLSNILTEKKSPIHDAVVKPIIKPSPRVSVANGMLPPHPQQQVNDCLSDYQHDLDDDNGFTGFDMLSEGVCVQKVKFKMNFFEYLLSQCTFSNMNNVDNLNSHLFSNNNQVFKTFYKQLESTLHNKDIATPCRLCSKFYKDYKTFLDLQKSEIITVFDK